MMTKGRSSILVMILVIAALSLLMLNTVLRAGMGLVQRRR